MLYYDFKKQYGHEEGLFQQEYVVEDARNKPKSKPDKQSKKKVRGKGKKRLIIALCILVTILCAALLYVEVFISGGLLGLFEKISPQAEYYYALSAACEDTLEGAKSAADVIKSKGGGGFVWFNGKYYALVTMYLDESAAKSVADRTGYAIISIPKNIMKATSFPIKVQNDASLAIAANEKVIEALYEVTVQKEDEVNTNKLAQILKEYKEETERFLQETHESENSVVVRYRAKISAVTTILNALAEKESVTAAKVRYVLLAVTYLLHG